MILSDITDVHINGQIKSRFPNEEFISVERINYCNGCYGCWFKTPGECVIKDEYSTLVKRIVSDGRLYVISKCCYGCFSPKMKAGLDRTLSLILPTIKTKKMIQWHYKRYKKRLKLGVIFYGDTTEEERNLAERLVAMQSHDAGYVHMGTLFGTEDEVLDNVGRLIQKAEGEAQDR